jgi:hypothetical protein
MRDLPGESRPNLRLVDAELRAGHIRGMQRATTSVPVCRPFLLFDAMALIAALGVGIAWTFSAADILLPAPPAEWSAITICEYALFVARVSITCPLLATGMITLLRLRRPRPSWARLNRQPGFAASLAVLSVTALNTLLFLAGWLIAVLVLQDNGAMLISLQREFGLISLRTLDNALPTFGMAVAAVWIYLAVSGRWRSEPGWLDRAGRALGCFWLAMIPTFGLYRMVLRTFL